MTVRNRLNDLRNKLHLNQTVMCSIMKQCEFMALLTAGTFISFYTRNVYDKHVKGFCVFEL